MSPKSLASLAALCVFQLTSFGQGVIGGNQNGMGPGGYLPKPPSPPAHETQNRLVASLTTAGYEFDLVTSGSNLVQVLVDPPSPVVVPLLKAAAAGKPSKMAPTVRPLPPVPGFWATFSLVNNTAADRPFTFPFQYWADNKIMFTVLDSTNTVLWQSVAIPVDVPPLAQPVNLILKAKSSWRKAVFVPFNPAGSFLADGRYVLEAAITGSPEFSATASFEVKTIQSTPVVPIVPAGTGIAGIAQVGPVLPVLIDPSLPRQAYPLSGSALPQFMPSNDVKPLPGAVIQVVEKRQMGVFYINPPFSAQTVADSNGNFSIDVPAGTYYVTGLPPQPGTLFPRGQTQTVQVTDGSYTNIVVNFDSGIRFLQPLQPFAM